MEVLTLQLLERMGVVLISTFLLTRIPLFRQLLDREINLLTTCYFSILFGIFGIAGTHAGVIIENGELVHKFWFFSLADNQAIATSSLVGVVIGGLLGGPVVGLGAGIISGVHLYSLGGLIALPTSVSLPITGVLAGLVARFFSQERVISPVKALFIGMFAPVLQMGITLIFTTHIPYSIELVNLMGIPLVITNSIAIAVFTTMIQVALQEEERSAADETKRAFKIAELTLPYLKQGLTPETAEATAYVLLKELKAAAVSITDTTRILAHVGVGASHHVSGNELHAKLSHQAIETGKIQVAMNRDEIQCQHPACPLCAGIFVPVFQGEHVIGLVQLFFKRPQQIRKIEVAIAKGLGNLISNQLNVALAEKMSTLMKDAELRVLQAQINPHFLFNTLNSIHTLIRVDQDLARHMIIQLSTFIRLNLKMTSSHLVPIHQEINHLTAYLEILKIRFSDQIKINCYTEPGLEDVLIPPATFQPLVENSIIHGLKHKPTGGEIDIRLVRADERVIVSIEDNGMGINLHTMTFLGDSSIKSKEGNGIGVYNVNQRLIHLLGPESRLYFANKDDGGCLITFSIPFVTQKRMVSS